METDQKKDRQGVSVKLPLMVMHKELGNVRADGHRRVYGYVCRSDGFASTEINIYCDGVKVAECRVARGGGSVGRKLARAMMYAYISGDEKRWRRKHNKVQRAAAAGKGASDEQE